MEVLCLGFIGLRALDIIPRNILLVNTLLYLNSFNTRIYAKPSDGTAVFRLPKGIYTRQRVDKSRQ